MLCNNENAMTRQPRKRAGFLQTGWWVIMLVPSRGFIISKIMAETSTATTKKTDQPDAIPKRIQTARSGGDKTADLLQLIAQNMFRSTLLTNRPTAA